MKRGQSQMEHFVIVRSLSDKTDSFNIKPHE